MPVYEKAGLAALHIKSYRPRCKRGRRGKPKYCGWIYKNIALHMRRLYPFCKEGGFFCRGCCGEGALQRRCKRHSPNPSCKRGRCMRFSCGIGAVFWLPSSYHDAGEFVFYRWHYRRTTSGLRTEQPDVPTISRPLYEADINQ